MERREFARHPFGRVTGSGCHRYMFDERPVVVQIREAWVKERHSETRPHQTTSRCVCGRRLELVGNVIIGRIRLAALLHLRQQLQGLLLLLGGVMPQEVGRCGQDGGSAGACHQVEADGEGDVDKGAVILLVLLLKRQDEL